jgi:hypothetical protein
MSARYGHAHRKLRARWVPRVERGEVACCLCGVMILPGPFDLAHDPMDAGRWLGPAHEKCNRDTRLEKRLQGRGRRGFHWRSTAW